MNTVLWILQGLIAVMFAMTGFMKLVKSKNELQNQGERMKWVESVSGRNLKFIGLLELLAALGLILPPLTGILIWLTPLAATGLALNMIAAMLLHIRRRDDAKAISMNIMLMLLAGFIAYGRFVMEPF
jgi:uncharacterized membrane protein YphA (DoxX/SURF4 family)